ncbi:MAG: hypothetical protein HY711_09430 [Candidatus Melainabacteria bacterium]|nr:hypothetical protein [Candidatus Melainabacteria bacterium]
MSGCVCLLAAGCTIGGDTNKEGIPGIAEVGDAQTYPADLPVPQYPGSKVDVNASMTSPLLGQLGQAMNNPLLKIAADVRQVSLTTTDPPKRVYDWYAQQIKSKGWKVATELAATEQGSGVDLGSLIATRDKKVFSVIATSPGEGGTNIMLSLRPEQ